MPRPVELNKTWLPGPSRGITTFNAPANLSIAYGRHVAFVSGRGGTGTPPVAVYSINYNTNYNIAYPVGNEPEASRPATSWVTNYNVAYPQGNQPETSWVTNYNVAYPQGNQPGTSWVTNYNVAYPQGNQPATSWVANYGVTYVTNPSSLTGYNTNYNVAYAQGNQPADGNYNPATSFNWNATTFYEVERRTSTPPQPLEYTVFVNTVNYSSGSNPTCPANTSSVNGSLNVPPGQATYDVTYVCTPDGNNPAYITNYNVVYPVANYGVTYVPGNIDTLYYPDGNTETSWVTNYNVVNTQANQPATSWVTNYNVVNTQANQPATSWVTNYNVVNTQANQPATSYSVLYNTNYNIAYPVGNYSIANYVINSYIPGVVGGSTNVLGVYFPGGPIGTIAPYIPETRVQYWDYPDDRTHAVVVASGGQIVVKLE